MAMQEVVCADCGAINQAVAHACWRCLEPLTDRAAATAEVAEPQPEPRPATA
ncbi:MAG: hypothetical protein ABI595_12450 [Actinomycetota bacterium]